jgi:hypothetical protein
MARGGHRPGAGRPKGAKDKKGPGKAKTPPSEIPQDIVDDAAAANMLPLDYMLMVMRDPAAEPARRDRMAQAAAPFVHARKESGGGKRDEKEDRAKRAAEGDFAPRPTPFTVVK